MNLVLPITSQETIVEIKKYLKSKPRDYMLFTLGINTGLRISDMLRLKVNDVLDVKHICIREGKTSKVKKFFVNTDLKKEITHYIRSNNLNSYLFPSMNDNCKPISRFCAHKILKKVAREFNLESFAAHSLRKTFGMAYYQKTKDIALLQQLFNHSSQTITLKYIGMSQQYMDESLSKFYL